MTLNIIVPTEMAPMYDADPICPIIVRSTSPISGTVIFDIIEGIASFSIFLSIEIINAKIVQDRHNSK